MQTLKEFTENAQKLYIFHTIKHLNWNKEQAAKALGISVATLYRCIERLGLKNNQTLKIEVPKQSKLANSLSKLADEVFDEVFNCSTIDLKNTNKKQKQVEQTVVLREITEQDLKTNVSFESKNGGEPALITKLDLQNKKLTYRRSGFTFTQPFSKFIQNFGQK